MMQPVRWLDYYCHTCGNQINSWDWRITGALMYKHPMCEKCIAKEYDETVDDLRAEVREFFGMEPCVGI